MNGIRIDIASGKITKIPKSRERSYDIRTCPRCDVLFEVRKGSKTKHCSMSCAKKGQKTRLGAKHSVETKERMREIHLALAKKRARMPKFERNHLKYAIKAYSKFLMTGIRPKEGSDECGLFKYGEWLFHNRHDK